ncbi:MAG: ATPase [Prevotella sp.]|nr:ATPase [Prevotella sp.]
MVLIADSGSTKTDWMLRGETATRQFHTQGINPIHQSDEQILDILRGELLPQLISLNQLSAIKFYGSGVRPDQEARMERLLREVFQLHSSHPTPRTPHPQIEAHSDLLGAARALCGDSEGLACILGTGANSCLYDGEKIVANTPPLGYILGDEGSGAVLGKRFLNALYKGQLSNETKSDFEAEMRMTLTEVIERVYRQSLPNRWLASLSPFIHSRLDDPAVEALVVDNFSDFIARNIEPYHRRDLPLQAVGSIAFYYRDQLSQAANKVGYAVGKILRSPLDGML